MLRYNMNKIQELAELVGISSSYIDKVGNTHYTSDYVREFFLKAMHYDTTYNIDTTISELKKEQIIPDVLSFYENEEISFNIKGTGSYVVCITNENNNIVWEETVFAPVEIKPKGLDVGYFNVYVKNDTYSHNSLLIYAPVYCYQPEFIKNKEKIFGISVMLYALRSHNNMGIGDFTALEDIVRLTAKHDGDIVGINPVGIMSPYILGAESLDKVDRFDVSPYRTISRLFVNYIYLDLSKEIDFKSSKTIQEYITKDDVHEYIKTLNNSDRILYKEVLELKLKLLSMMYDEFKKRASSQRKEQFLSYISQKGEILQNLCLFEALAETAKNSNFWRYWENNFDDINSKEVAEFRKKNTDRINFYAYCHWLADIQIKSVQNLAESLGMKIGLYSDMPIGAASNGAEVWENPKAYVLEAGIGAPADPMRPKGQSWGFTPHHPQELKKQHYAPFIKLVRENMQYSKALRIDHAMGLQRLFWGFFTEDNPVVQGAYIYYDIKDLTAILAIESNRHQCLVIGEDLGTVSEGFREYMAEHGLLSYKVFFRQKEKNGEFIAPEKYQYMSLAQPSTHDQATAFGFWQHNDIEVFKQCNLYVNDEQYKDNVNGRNVDCDNIIKAFEKEGIPTENIKNNLHFMVNEYGAKTNSALFLVRLCDILKQVDLDNAPGTVYEYPNWRKKLAKTNKEIENCADFEKMMNIIKKYRNK